MFSSMKFDILDLFSLQVVNGGKLKMEDCIRKEVQDLIGKCTLTEKEERPDLLQIKQELERICEQLTREGD